MLNLKATLAPLALLALLLGGNALVAQVEQDIQHQLEAPAGGEVEVPGQTPPLRLNNLRLPQDLSLKLPENLKLDPEDLSKLTLPEGLDVEVPEGFDLDDLDFDLPTEFDLTLPAGSVFDPLTGNLSLPNGGRIALPDGTKLDLPPGTTLRLPPELQRRLLDMGLPAGALSKERTFHLEGLPPGLNVGMDPPALPGNGTLSLPPGTQLRLPPGVEIPDWALLGGLPFILPAGTEILVPPDVRDGFPLPVPAKDATRPDPARPPPVDPGLAVATDIDTYPARVPKGESFYVEGYVRELATGRDVPGAPVVVYVNETKATPGTLVGRGQSDAEGRFRIHVSLPTDRPARTWQLVNHAGAFTAADGTRYADGWGDPPFETFADTAWTLDVPARDGLQGATGIRGILLDATGAPVPLARVEMLVDGVLVQQGATTAEGVFDASYAFTTTGAHTVRLRFPGNAYYGASESAERTILIEEVAIEVAPNLRAERGSALPFSGRLLVGGIAAPGRSVEIVFPFGSPQRTSVVTDDTGSFRGRVAVPVDAPLGELEITYRSADHGVSKTQRVDVWTRARIVLDAPERAQLSQGVTATPRLVDLEGNPIAGETLEVTLSGPGGSLTQRGTTSEEGALARALVPPQATQGEYELVARVPDEARVNATAARAIVRLAPLDVAWDLPATVVRGRGAAVSATLLFGGEPLAGERLALSFFQQEGATTDAFGRASWTVAIPTQAPLGPAQAQLALPLHGFQESRETLVVAQPLLALGLPYGRVPGEPVEANLTLRDDLGQPLAGHRVELSLRAGAWTRTINATTDAQGRWTQTLDLADAPAADLAVAAFHPEQARHLDADDAGVVTLAAASAGTPVLHPLLWGVPLLAVLGVAGGAGVVATRRRLRAAPPPAPSAPMATLVHAPGFDLDLGIPAGEPLVWGVGDALEVALVPTGASAGRRAVRLTGGGHDLPLPLDAGVQRATLVFREEGDARIVAQRVDDPLAAPVTVDLRIVDYRKEIAREFDLLLDRARAVEPAIDRQSTAQEVEWMLGHRLGAAAAAPLGDMSLVMDVASYSDQPVARHEYLRFVAALRAIDPMLSGGAA